MAEKLKYFVNGQFRESKTDKWYDLHNPSTGEITGQAPCCTNDEVLEAIAAAKAAYPGWSATPAIKRAQILYRVRELILERMDELTMSVAKENGKVWAESEGDVLKAKEGTELATQVPSLMMGESIMDASRGYDTVKYREPLGVFAGIVPVNFPAMIPFGWMAPTCIATGNTLVLKAASLTPKTAMLFAQLYKDAGVPDGVINVVTCSRNEINTILEHPDVKGITFVGSTPVGLKSRCQRQALPGPVPGQEPCPGDGGLRLRAYGSRRDQLCIRLCRSALHGVVLLRGTGQHCRRLCSRAEKAGGESKLRPCLGQELPPGSHHLRKAL